jgi:tRNA dimethylallyltransferase
MSIADKNKRLIVISGATAIGKTALSIQLAQHFNSEIISADSRQFYKELKIGATPPSQEELIKVKHHFIQHLSVKDNYNVGLFEKDAIAVLYTLFKKTDTLIMAGGSGLYIDAVCNGLDTFPEVDEKIKKELIAEYKNKGITFLQDELKKRDPVYFDIVDINNPQRLIRALAVIRESRKPFSSFRNKTSAKRDFKISHFSLEMEREKLYERINRRVDLMMEEKLLKEVENLIPYKNKNALQTVGYKELFSYFDGEISLEEAINKIKQNTRRFAKRQISWFKREEGNQHVSCENAFQKIIKSSPLKC